MTQTGKSILIGVAPILVVVVVLLLFVDPIPPHSLTYGAMHMCKRRVLRYAHEHGKLPAALNETEPIDGYNSSIKDGWGAVLEYSVDANSVITFRSLGEDRKPGGTGRDSDIIGVFPAKQPDGSWSDEFVEWSKDPIEP